MGPSGQTSAPAEVMDEKPIGEDPHMQEQQRNSGEADMCSQLEEEVQGAQLASQTRPAPGKRMGSKSPSRWTWTRPILRSWRGTSTRPAPGRWRVSMGPSGQTAGRPSSGLKTLPASSGKGISSNRWRSRVKVPRQTIFAMVWWLLNLRASSLEGNFIPDPTQYFPRRALESVCVSATASWPSWPEAR